MLVCLYAFLGATELTGINESQRLEPAREMVETGDWVVPRIDGRPYLSKPPLIYWMIGASFELLGPSAWTGRLPIALAGTLTLLGLMGIGRRAIGKRYGLLAATILATNHYYMHKCRVAQIDPVLTAVTLGAFYAFWRTVNAEERWPLPALATGVLVGAGLLLKGPVILLFMTAALAAALLAVPANRKRTMAAFGLSLGIGVVVFLPWVLALIHRLGMPTLWDSFNREALERVTQASRINSGPIYYYLVQESAGFLPWTLAAGLLFFKTVRRDVARRFRENRFLQYVGWITLGAFLIFSLIAGKETEYLLPLFPLFALLASIPVGSVLFDPAAERPWRAMRWGIGVLAAILAVSPVVLLTPGAKWFFQFEPTVGVLAVGSVLAVACLASLPRSDRVKTLLLFLLAFVLVESSVLTARMLRSDAKTSIRPLIASTRPWLDRPGTVAYRWRIEQPKAVWILENMTRRLPDQADLDEPHPAVSRTSAVIFTSRRYEKAFRNHYGAVWRIVRTIPGTEHDHIALIAEPAKARP